MTHTSPTVTDELSARLLAALGAPALVELTAFIALANLYSRTKPPSSSSRKDSRCRASCGRSPRGGPKVTWGSPPVRPKTGKSRMHFDLAPPVHGDQQSEVDHLVSLGATRIDIGQGEVSWVVMADPDGNEFCVVTPR